MHYRPLRRIFCRPFCLPAGLLALGYLGLALFAGGCSDALIFPAPRASYDAAIPGCTILPDKAGDIAAIWLPKAEAKNAVLYFHGNGEDIGHNLDAMTELRRTTGCAVLAVDYPGYGLSPGEPSEEGCLRAADIALKTLSEKYGYPAERVTLFGRSLGTGVAIDLAARTKVHGLVLWSPYKSIFRVITRVKILPFDTFDSLAKIDAVTCPLLVIHGDADRVIPFAHGEAIFAAAANAKAKTFLRLPGAGHNDPAPESAEADYRSELRRVASE